MKILIVEDETVAYENLIDILSEIDPAIEVVDNTESIRQTIHWLQIHPSPDLILMDIHLSDGSAFSIFNTIEVETPIIFTTAFDEYAIEAFKVNSIGYLLKPIKTEELKQALHKFSKWTHTDVLQYLSRVTQLHPPKENRYKTRILVPVKDQLIPVDTRQISCFYSTDKSTRIFLSDGNSYPYSKSLDNVSSSLDPNDFFRANKQFIISRHAVATITIWFDSRLLVTLNVETPERIFISKNKAAEFKGWMVED